MWEFLTEPQNRELLGWLGAALAAVAAGAWAVFKYLHRPGRAGDAAPTVTANRGVAAVRDINARDITFSMPGKPTKRKR